MSENKTIIYVVEMATHFSDDNTDFVKIPIDICKTEDQAIESMNTGIAAYCESFDSPEIDRTVPDDVIVYEEPGKKYPYAEFWFYKAEVIPE